MGKNKKEMTPEEVLDEIRQEAKNEAASQKEECGACCEENKNAQTEACPDKTGQNKAEEELKEEKEKYLRLYADFDNYRKRAAKEKSEISLYAQSEIMEKLLPILDNFERAVAAESTDKSFKDGIEMVARQLKDAVTSAGLTEIKAECEKFDPNLHYAVMTDSNKDVAEDTVTEVLQKGYMFKEKILRPAMVKVNKIN